MPLTIPLPPGLPFFDLQASLESVTYTGQINYNPRQRSFYLDLLDDQGTTMLLAGLRLVVGWPLAAYITGRSPPGIFMASDTSGQGVDPDLGDLGTRVKLVYFSATELGIVGT